jgi:hypothetical protein
MPRDYLKEAYDIFDGRKLKIRKDHIDALVNRLHSMSKKAHLLAVDLQTAVLQSEERMKNEMAAKNLAKNETQIQGGN